MSDDAEKASSAVVPVTGRSAQTPLVLRLVGEIAAMIRFYSRLPVPALGAFDDPANPPSFVTACRMLPLASLVIGLPAVIVIALLGPTALPSPFVAVLAAAVGIAVTGALHEDGLADTVDGFGGGRDLPQKLAIMKDSRIGSYGAAALVLALIGRVALLAALLAHAPLIAAAALLAAAIASRTLSLGLFAALPGARADGVASAVGQPDFGAVLIACGLTIVLIFALTWAGFGGWHALLGLVAAGAVTIALGRIAMTQIGGQTGDVIGAAQVLAEIAFLGGLLAF